MRYARSRMPHALPALPYAFNALEPHIDEQTMRLHHGKHHQTYVDKLNTALDGHPDLQALSLEALLKDLAAVPEKIRTQVKNHGGGHANHSVFWTNMRPKGGGDPSGPLASALGDAFGSIAAFREAFSNAANGMFGSGWAWLILDATKKLSILARPNQDSPWMENLTPLLGLDVWEHAYYLKYQNRRAEYVVAWWNVVNWEDVSRRYVDGIP